MIELSDLFRVRGNTLEIFATGLSHMFTDSRQGAVNNLRKERAEFICNKIQSYCQDNRISLSDYSVILDCRLENFYMSSLGKRIAEQLNLSTNKTLILTSVDPKESTGEYKYELDLLADINSCYFYEELLKREIEWESIEIDRPIMCLAGRPTEYRAKFTKNLLDLCKDRARVSLGNVSQYPLSNSQIETYNELLHPYGYPVSQGTDGKVIGYVLDNQKSPGDILFKSLVSIINETNDFTNTNVQLSEKSFKVFAWHQIPIFMASPKQVETIRNIGFDMFDDIIDHSYDTAPTLGIHDLKILNVVAKFLKKYPTAEDVNNLRKALYPRLKANNDLLYSLYLNRKYEPWPYYS